MSEQTNEPKGEKLSLKTLQKQVNEQSEGIKTVVSTVQSLANSVAQIAQALQPPTRDVEPEPTQDPSPRFAHATSRRQSIDARRDRHESGRNRRIPMGSPNMKLAIAEDEKDPNYHYHIFNDDGVRLQRALQAGYKFVQKDEIQHVGEGHNNNSDPASGVSVLVGTRKDGSEMRGFLMRLPMDLREDDLAEKESQIRAQEEAIEQGVPQGNDLRKTDTYVPREGISINATRRRA